MCRYILKWISTGVFMRSIGRLWVVLGLVYGLFLAWHHNWLAKPLTPEEVKAILSHVDGKGEVTPQEAANLRNFFNADDGQPFYNLNLMEYRDQATYADGAARPGIVTGVQADAEYGRLVLPLLLKRGSYPVFVTTKAANLLNSAGQAADFFQRVAVVRYRSRRDMLDMIADPAYALAGPHKFASLARNVAVPLNPVMVLHAGHVVPVLLLLVGLAGSLLLQGGQLRRSSR